MQIVTGPPLPTQNDDEARASLFELAAVIRTIFGAGLPAQVQQPATTVQEVAAPEPIAAPAPLAAVPPPAVAAPSLPIPEVAALDVPDLPEAPALAVPRTPDIEASAAIPVPSIQVPAAPLAQQDHESPAERHSMALLQEIAFLDD